jgi:ABC-type microcin C transport system permease subunit YejB
VAWTSSKPHKFPKANLNVYSGLWGSLWKTERQVVTIIASSITTETVFVCPGLGRLVFEALLTRDFPVIQGVVLIWSPRDATCWTRRSGLPSVQD